MAVNLTDTHIEHGAEKYQKMLANLQGNILKGHGRDHSVHIFLKFTSEPHAVRGWMSGFTGSPHFVRADTGIDPVIGQKEVNGRPIEQHWPREWGKAGGTPFHFADCVKLKGGEFFFAPSIPFLRSL